MCNLYSITTNQAAILALFPRGEPLGLGNLQSKPGVFPDYPAAVIRKTPSPLCP